MVPPIPEITVKLISLTYVSLKFECLLSPRPPSGELFAIESGCIALLLQIWINCAWYNALGGHFEYIIAVPRVQLITTCGLSQLKLSTQQKRLKNLIPWNFALPRSLSLSLSLSVSLFWM